MAGERDKFKGVLALGREPTKVQAAHGYALIIRGTKIDDFENQSRHIKDVRCIEGEMPLLTMLVRLPGIGLEADKGRIDDILIARMSIVVTREDTLKLIISNDVTDRASLDLYGEKYTILIVVICLHFDKFSR